MHEVSEWFVLLTESFFILSEDRLLTPQLTAPVPLKQIAAVGGSSAMV